MIARERLQFTLGDRIRKAIIASPLTQQELADRLGVHTVTVGRWTRGYTEPKPRTLAMIATHTGVPLSWLETGKP